MARAEPGLPFGGELPEALATAPRLLAHNAAKWPDAVAIRQKELGIWRQMTWDQCLSRTRAIALGLAELGIGEGQVVGYIGQNRPDLLFTEIATHALGALSLGIYKDSLKEELAYLVNHAEVGVVVAEDEEQVDKLLELSAALTSLRHIVYVDPRGMRKHSDPRLMPITDMAAAGERRHAADPTAFAALIERTRPDAPAILCTTSGTTSHPKLAILRSGPFLRHGLSLLTVEPKGPEDDYVLVLALPWIGEQVNAVAHFLLSRIRLNFVEDEETTGYDMREIGPTHILQAPRVWEAMAADIRARMMESTPLKRLIYALAMKLGSGAAAIHRRSRMTDILLGRALRDRLGLSRIHAHGA